MSSSTQNSNSENVHHLTEDQLREVRRIADTVRYGTVTLVFQDGRLVQIERNEKIRLK